MPETRRASQADDGAPRFTAAATWLAVAALVGLVFAAFAPALGASFVNWDDPQNLTQNRAWRGLDLEHLRWMFTTSHMGPYQPLAWLSLAVDHALWGLSGPTEFPEAPRYHGTNIVLHALAAIALFFGTRRLLARVFRGATRHVNFAAFVAAAFFALHPLRVESVAWVTERRDVLCGVFFALAIYAWLRAVDGSEQAQVVARRSALAFVLSLGALLAAWIALDTSTPKRLALSSFGGPLLAFAIATLVASATLGAPRSRVWNVVATLALLAALLSKGLAMVLPAMLVVADVVPLRRVRDLRSLAASITEKAPLFALSLLFARLAMWGQASVPGVLVSWERHTLVERLMQAAYGLVFYVRETLLPFALAPLYELPDELTLGDPRFALSVLVLAALVIALVVVRKRATALVAALTAYAIAITPVLGFTQAGPQLVADRYSYFACIPFAWLVGALVVTRPTLIVRGGVLLSLAIYGAHTFLLSRTWHDSESLWSRGLSFKSRAVLAHVNYGQAFVEKAERETTDAGREADLRFAESVFQRALEQREHPLLVSGLAVVHQRLWELDPRTRGDDAKLALEFAERATALARARGELTSEYHLNLGSAQFNAGRIDEALPELEEFVRAEPDSFRGRYNLGFALVRAKRNGEAVAQLERAVELEPSIVNAWGNLGFAYEGAGRRDDAIRAYRRVLALAPNHATAKQRLSALGASAN